MSAVSGDKGPALLRLAKWDPSPVFNFEDFHEGFLSPTRELMLLLSHHREALLHPLVAGNFKRFEDPDSPLYEPTHTGKVNSVDHGSYYPGSAPMNCSDESTVERSLLGSDSHLYISDVNSVAWAASGDTCNPNGDDTFREFLFVSGNNGVTVHAFRQFADTSEMTKSCSDVECDKGKWVDWEPCITSSQGTTLSTCTETETNKSVVTVEQYLSEDQSGGVADNPAPKRWLQSFLSKAETLHVENNVWTKFPDESSYPCNAKIVSFTLFEKNSLSDISSHGDPLLNASDSSDESASLPGAPCQSGTGRGSKTDILSYLLKEWLNTSYKCTRVISSHQINLIGFLLSAEEHSVASANNASVRNLGNSLLLVARLDHWGMQWLCCVQLEESKDLDEIFEWVDFQLSGELIACLRASGSIILYGTSTGEYVTHIDILSSCGFSHLSHDQELNGSLHLDYNEGRKIEKGSSCKKIKNSLGGHSKIIFKKLIVASHFSLISAVDESGIVYVMRLCDLLPHSSTLLDSKLSHLQTSKYGLLTGWEVAGSDISCQKVFPELSCSQTRIISTLRSISSDYPTNENRFDVSLSGFSSLTRKQVSHYMRKVFIPSEKFSLHDHISISSFGVTRLVKSRNTIGKNSLKTVHTSFHLDSAVDDIQFYNSEFQLFKRSEGTNIDDAIGCVSQGCLYLLARDGLLVALPNVSLSSSLLPVDQMNNGKQSVNVDIHCQNMKILGGETSEPLSQWKVEVLDKVIIYECPKEADLLCLRNGWDLKVARTRRLELALEYLQFNELKQSLESLVDVDLAEEGVLRLIFAAVCLLFRKAGADGDVSSALRILTLASAFATKMVLSYGMSESKKSDFTPFQVIKETPIHFLPSNVPIKNQNNLDTYGKLSEMAYLLEVIRNLQCRLTDKFRRPVRVDGEEAFSSMGLNSLEDVSHPSAMATDQKHDKNSLIDITNVENNALMLAEPSSRDNLDMRSISEVAIGGIVSLKQRLSTENPKDMMSRWESETLDIKTIVKEALLAGRLPLAVLQLQIQRSKDVQGQGDKEPSDTFTEVRKVGRSIAYELFLKGEAGIAVGILQRLGEDIESSLKQLVFGTVRKSLRVQLVEEMRIYGYLGPYEAKMLDRMSLLEKLYPSSNFWRTFQNRQEQLTGASSSLISSKDLSFAVLHTHLFKNVVITSGDIDGVVLGVWESLDDVSSLSEATGEDCTTCDGFWAAAVVWSDVWDQKTFDRMALDCSRLPNVELMWEAQFEYHLCHNNLMEVRKLLKMVPRNLLSDGTVHIGVDYTRPSPNSGRDKDFPVFNNYAYSVEEPDATHITVPFVNVFRFPLINISSLWLATLIEVDLAQNLIFSREYWEGTSEIMLLLARSGLIIARPKMKIVAESSVHSSNANLLDTGGEFQADTVRGLDKLVVYHSMQYNLPNLLDLYFDYSKWILDEDSCRLFKDSTEHCEWVKWLILTGIKGLEYDASFSNCRSVMSSISGNSVSIPEVDEVIHTVDDMAEGGGEMAALATLMYAPIPIQNCLSTGSINRNSSSSAQCTLENLRPSLQRFPTLWRTLVAACFGQDVTDNLWGPKEKHVTGSSSFMEYLHWRDNVFFSTGHDTSILQMLPCWFPKSVRRLVQLYVQGPLGWQSFAGEESFAGQETSLLTDASGNEISSISWEAAIQKQVEQELHESSLEEAGLGIEHHLHRGRPIAAFNHLLYTRAKKLKSERGDKGQSGSSVTGPMITQSDVQTLLTPITQAEESLLSSVIPLAIMHFENSTLVASCAFLLELCGVPVSLLRIDVAALKRISSHYGSNGQREQYKHMPDEGTTFHGASHDVNPSKSLARALADDYLHYDGGNIEGSSKSSSSKRSLRSIMYVLQHLEKASLPPKAGGETCGTWLSSGDGDGAELRSQQKDASLRWNLVTDFCQMHRIPLSTKYLAVLARDNDWVAFLSEAHTGGYPFESIVNVASREFTDPRLRTHMLTVLKGMQTRKQVLSSSNPNATHKGADIPFLDNQMRVPSELFEILADCEKQPTPGEALLRKAKDMCWSILALIASCFPDVSPLSCLVVWLEITAARETTSIKVNDIASQIASNVGAAVEATNLLSMAERTITFHYNRRSPKRRRLMESTSGYNGNSSSIASISENGIVGPENSISEGVLKKFVGEHNKGSKEVSASLSNMVAVLCEQQLFLPLLRAFEIFLPSCSLVPFIRALQAFSQMRLTEAAAHLGSFSIRIKEDLAHVQTFAGKDEQLGTTWISSTAVKAADAVFSTCPSPYEKKCLLQLLSDTDFGDGGYAVSRYQRLHWKINIAEPLLRKDNSLHLGDETLDDSSLLAALEKCGHWEQGRTWAKQLEAIGDPWKSAANHVTETQAESMVIEWREFLWDVPEERLALWAHCHTLFFRHSYPPLQAGLFFLKHAESMGKDLTARELHEVLLLSLQWLSGMITQSNPVYQLHQLREIETRVWLLAVKSEAQLKNNEEFVVGSSRGDTANRNVPNIIDKTASMITKMDNHINNMRSRSEMYDAKDYNQAHKNTHSFDPGFPTVGSGFKSKRRAKGYLPSRRLPEATDAFSLITDVQVPDENVNLEVSLSRWEERVGPAELERAVLSLLEFGQYTAAKQLQEKLSPTTTPHEFLLMDVTLKLAALSPVNKKISKTVLDEQVQSVIRSHDIMADLNLVEPLQVLETIAGIFSEGCGRGFCKRIISVVRAASVLGLSFSEAFDKQPVEVLQLLSLKAQDSFEEAKLLVQTHSMPAASIAQVLAESFLKGLLAAHRGGYIDCQKEEGPAPLLWRFSDFLKWVELCPSEPEVGHALMRLVITGQEIPHACEVELLILSHHFYKLSACLDGVDVLVELAATRVEAYVMEGDFACLARLITGVGNFHALNFILGILIENGQLDLLLQKFSAAADTNTGTAEAVRGFRMAVLTSLKHYSPDDLDAYAMVYNHFDMKHETASLLESRAMKSINKWSLRKNKDHNEDLLDSMRFYIEAAEVHSSIDAGNKTRVACAQASVVSLQIRMPDFQWLNLSETNARRALVDQSRFPEALIIAEAYGFNQPGEWTLVLWNLMLKPELLEQFVNEFVAVLPLQPSTLFDLAKFYKSEMQARGDQSQFSVWLTGGGLPADWAKYLWKSFRCLLKRTRDLRTRLQLANAATWHGDIVDACVKIMDKVPDNAGPLILKKGHGGAYLPVM